MISMRAIALAVAFLLAAHAAMPQMTLQEAPTRQGLEIQLHEARAVVRDYASLGRTRRTTLA